MPERAHPLGGQKYLSLAGGEWSITVYNSLERPARKRCVHRALIMDRVPLLKWRYRLLVVLAQR